MERFAELSKATDAFQQSARTGHPDYVQFAEDLARVGKANPNNGKLGDFVAEVLKSIDPLKQAQEEMEGVGAKLTGLLSSFDRARAGLHDLVPNRLTDRQQLDMRFTEAQNALRAIPADGTRFTRGTLESMQVANANDYKAALDEIARKEGEISEARAVDLRPVEVSPAAMDWLRASLNGEAQ